MCACLHDFGGEAGVFFSEWLLHKPTLRGSLVPGRQNMNPGAPPFLRVQLGARWTVARR
jgi:hypothetical protein